VITRPPRIAAAGLSAALLLLAVSPAPPLAAHDVRVRRRPRVPDVAGYRTLLCDFHTHTVFSDGSVWPDIRVEEAWREGFDAVAITDHIEYRPHAADITAGHERSYEIARPHGDKLDVLVIRGSEVTRSMPPGHLNAIFLDTVAPLETPDWRDALRRARGQGAFIFWNHPGWRGQQPDGQPRWYPEHTEILEKGLLDGIEVVHERDYFPQAHRYSIEKKLAPLASSDIHRPLNLDYHVLEGDHRPTTLVFARDRSVQAIKEALFARRTVAWSGDLLIGAEELLRALFDASVRVENARVRVGRGDVAFVRIRNDSDLRFHLAGPGRRGLVRAPETVVVAPMGTSVLEIIAGTQAPLGVTRLDLAYTVTNLKATPDAGLPFTLAVEVEVVPLP
jgi:predicted metal-dependent phosphoesterase TrpH